MAILSISGIENFRKISLKNFLKNLFDQEKNFQRFKNPEDATKNLEFNYFLVSGKNFQESVPSKKNRYYIKIFRWKIDWLKDG